MTSAELALKLNPKQKLFAEWCAKGKTQVEAYQLAGYKTENMKPETLSRASTRCMGNVHVRAYYDSLLEESTNIAVEELSYQKTDWMKTQFELLNMAMGKQETKLVTSFMGEFVSADKKVVDLSAALRAQEQLGKTLALFIDKQELNGDLTVTNLIKEISAEAGSSEEDSPLPKDNM